MNDKWDVYFRLIFNVVDVGDDVYGPFGAGPITVTAPDIKEAGIKAENILKHVFDNSTTMTFMGIHAITKK